MTGHYDGSCTANTALFGTRGRLLAFSISCIESEQAKAIEKIHFVAEICVAKVHMGQTSQIDLEGLL